MAETNVVTEDQFPLPQREDNVIVMVEWSDLSESPSQAVRRLTTEVIEADERQALAERALRRNVDATAALSEFEIERDARPEAKGVRVVRHTPCGTSVGVLPVVDISLGQIVETAGHHDCSIHALIQTKKNSSSVLGRLVNTARQLCAGTLNNRDYVRGIAEMLVTSLDLPKDRIEEVYEWLREGPDLPF